MYCNARCNILASTKRKTRNEVWGAVREKYEKYIYGTRGKRFLTRKQQTRAKSLLLTGFLNLIMLLSSVDLKAMNFAGTSIKFS